MANLTIKQQRFCEHYAKNGNASESLKLAGYSDKYANSNASKLLQNTAIQNHLKTLTQPESDKRIMDATERQQLLTQIARDDEQQTKDRLKALDLLCKVQGDYSDAAMINNVIMPTVIELIDG